VAGRRGAHRAASEAGRRLRAHDDADAALAGLVGASDGELTVGQLVGALAQLLEVDEAALAADVLPRVRELVVTGFLSLA